jgi:adenylylsulfate kinase
VAVVTTSISPYRDARDECRQMIGRFVEVYVRAPEDAEQGAFDEALGLTDPYEPPAAPELVIRGKADAPDAAALRIVRRLEELGYLPAQGDADEAIVRAQLKALQDR